MTEEYEHKASHLGEYLRELRLTRKMTLSLAARRMKMKPQKLCDIEAGRRHNTNMPIEMVMAFAKVYGVKTADIVANIETVVQTAKTVAELLMELQPNIRMAEMLAKQLFELSKTYPPQVESAATDLYKYVKNSSSLVFAINKRYVGSDKLSLLEDEERKVAD